MAVVPRVRVVVVDYEGGEHTKRCVRHLRATEWPEDRLEIVVVDNGSTQPLAERLDVQGLRVIRSEINLGFAGGCNLGLHDRASVDHIALVNNDAFVEPDWLAPLVDALGRDQHLGAACPKILFADELAPAVVEVRPPGTRARGGVLIVAARSGDLDVSSSVKYRSDAVPEPGGRRLKTATELFLPTAFENKGFSLELAAPVATDVELRTRLAVSHQVVGRGSGWFELPPLGAGETRINNVGNSLVIDGYGADRGYLEVDRGQHDEPTEVFAWCGAAVLLRSEYLEDVGLLDERLFLYYEDFELSWRGRDRGWTYMTVPRSVVRHLHSAATGEGSSFGLYYKERNHLLVLLRHGRPRVIVTAWFRFVLITLSYVRSEILAPLCRRQRPRPGIARARFAALCGATRRSMSMLVSRRRDRARTVSSSRGGETQRRGVPVTPPASSS